MSAPLIDLERLRRESFVCEIEWHESLRSTNDRGLELAARESLATPLLILAKEQQAGRGRGANRWWSGEGALTFTLVLDPAVLEGAALRVEHWPRVALAAGLALCEAIDELVPHLECRLKWPNDVLLSGRKLAGILVEIPPTRAPVPRRLVLGMGINVNNSLIDAPLEIQAVGTALCDATGLEFDTTRLLCAWLNRFHLVLKCLAADDPALAARWQSRCVLTGRTVELDAAGRQVRGVCHGIDAEGALIVETAAGGRERLYGGVLVRTTD